MLNEIRLARVYLRPTHFTSPARVTSRGIQDVSTYLRGTGGAYLLNACHFLQLNLFMHFSGLFITKLNLFMHLSVSYCKMMSLKFKGIYVRTELKEEEIKFVQAVAKIRI